jgi:hypothetical protein
LPADAVVGDEMVDPVFFKAVAAHVAASGSVGVLYPLFVVTAVSGP